MPSDWPSYNGKSLFETNFTTKLAKIPFFSSSLADFKNNLIMKNLLFKGFFALACLLSLTAQAQISVSGRVTHHCTGAGYPNAIVYVEGRDFNNSPIVSYVTTDADGYWDTKFPCAKRSSLALVSIYKPIRVSGTYSVQQSCVSGGVTSDLDFTVVPNLPTLKYQSSLNGTVDNVTDATIVTGCQDGDNGARFSYAPQPDMFYRLAIYNSDIYGNNLGIAAASGWQFSSGSNTVSVNPLMSNLAAGDYLVQLEENCDGSNFSQKWGGQTKRIRYVRGASQYDVDFFFGVPQAIDGSTRNNNLSYNTNRTDGLLGRSLADMVNIPEVGPNFTTIYLNSGTSADKAAVTSYTLTVRKGGNSTSPIVGSQTWNNATSLPNLLYLFELVGFGYFAQPANVNSVYRVEFTAEGPCGTKQAWSRFFITPNNGTCPSWPNCFAGDDGVLVQSLKQRLSDPTVTLKNKSHIEQTLQSVSRNLKNTDNSQNVRAFPNPTNGNTNLAFTINEANNVEVQLYDIAGKLMATALPKQHFEKGTHQTTLPTEGVAKGVYIYKVVIGKETVSGKVIKL